MLRTRQGTQVDQQDIGSLAPKQKYSRLVLVFGPTAWGMVNVDFTQNNNTNVIIASAKASAQTWPMWIFIAIMGGICISLVIKSRLTKRKIAKSKNAKPIPTLKKAGGKKNEQ
jgi:hypothetical protein